jgi:hypothetical protein
MVPLLMISVKFLRALSSKTRIEVSSDMFGEEVQQPTEDIMLSPAKHPR